MTDDYFKIRDEIEAILKADGIEAVSKRLEELVGEDMPKGVCICESDQGSILIIGSKAEDADKLQEWRWKMMKVFGVTAGMSYADAKNSCTGNYTKKG